MEVRAKKSLGVNPSVNQHKTEGKKFGVKISVRRSTRFWFEIKIRMKVKQEKRGWNESKFCANSERLFADSSSPHPDTPHF